MGGEVGALRQSQLEVIELPDGWRWTRVEDVCDGLFDCPHSTPTLTEYGPLMARTQDILGGMFKAGQAVRVSEQTYRARIQRAEPRFGDLFYSREGTYFGIAAEVPPDCEVCLGQRMVLLRPNPARVHGRFLRYWLNSPTMSRFVRGFRDGTVAERLNLSTIRALPVVLPPLSEQRAIACILGSLDDKIELNRRMNQTLEGIARAIFKSWFVDFDPVHAKAESRDPGLPSEIADLFPSSFVDSELGPIPEGWEAGSFGDVVSQRSQRVGQGHAVVLSAVATGKLVRSDQHFDKRVYSENTAKYLAVEQWDFAYNPSRINIGSIGMLEQALLGAVSPVYVVFRPSPAYRWFVYFSLRRADVRSWISTLASGSVRQSLSFKDFTSIPRVVPPLSVIAQFDRIWNPIREAMAANTNATGTLAALRDTLLPKLISGELRVPDAERIVGRCV